MKKIFLLILIIPIITKAQENPLKIFKPLEKGVWCAEGKWGDGSNFKQEISFKFSLDNKIVKVESMGFTNKDQTEFGLRNYGVRHYDANSDTIRFWEFDIFGTLTEGTVKNEGKNLIYKYKYGENYVTEMWIYKNKTTYDFIVGVYENKTWQHKFLETEIIRKIE